MSASAWVNDLQAAIQRYSRSRRTTPVVRITLANGESHYVMSASVGEPNVLVAFDVYPESMQSIDDLLAVERSGEGRRPEVERVTHKMLVVPPHAITKVEIADEHPGRAEVGFRATSGEASSDE